MLRLAFDFIITWRETRTRPNAYHLRSAMTMTGAVYQDIVVLFLALFDKVRKEKFTPCLVYQFRFDR